MCVLLPEILLGINVTWSSVIETNVAMDEKRVLYILSLCP